MRLAARAHSAPDALAHLPPRPLPARNSECKAGTPVARKRRAPELELAELQAAEEQAAASAPRAATAVPGEAASSAVPSPAEKACMHCGEVKPGSAFRRSKNLGDGLQNRCKVSSTGGAACVRLLPGHFALTRCCCWLWWCCA